MGGKNYGKQSGDTLLGCTFSYLSASQALRNQYNYDDQLQYLAFMLIRSVDYVEWMYL